MEEGRNQRMMKLYWSPRSRSFSALWLMEETGQPYERVLSRGSTDGLPGAAGRPSGVAVVGAAVHAPSAEAPTAATWHWYGVPFVSPVTVAVVASDTPSLDSIQLPSPA
jgi:hypothetical protein